MNGLKPKIKRSGVIKPRNNVIGSPIYVKSFPETVSGSNFTVTEKFLNAASADEQLSILKNIIEEQKVFDNTKIVQFFAIVFYEAPAKHPVKCFLARHVSRCSRIQGPFTEHLSAHILAEIEKSNKSYNDFQYYAEVVPKMILSLENFLPGVTAIEALDAKLIIHCIFLNYFLHCRKDLRNSSLMLTNRNQIVTLEHLMLRLIVHIIQKINVKDISNDWPVIFQSMTTCVEELITDDEVPMDTKSLSGILLLSLETLKLARGEAWKVLLESNGPSHPILGHKMGQLVVYSAIATTVPMEKLQEPGCNGTPAILTLLGKLTEFTDGSGAEPAQTLCVARALLHLSKSLGMLKVAQNPDLGARSVDYLLAFVWSHLEYHMDSVRHLTQQILTNVLGFCAELERGVHGASDPHPLAALLKSLRSLGRRRGVYWAVPGAASALGAARVARDLCDPLDLMDAAEDQHLHAAVCVAISALISCSPADAEELFRVWVLPSLERPSARGAVLAAVVERQPTVADTICERISGAALLACCGAVPACRARLSRDTLLAAAVNSDDETRLLSLSLACSSSRPSVSELSSALSFLKYNMNAPRAAFRNDVIDHFKKLFKRIETSYRASSEDVRAQYILFVERVRERCACAARGGNSRRGTALQLLTATESLQLGGHKWSWSEHFAECLLPLLDDGYPSNRELAIQVLRNCPENLLTGNVCGDRLHLNAVLELARSVRPADSARASAWLRLLLARTPARVLQGNEKHVEKYTGEQAWLPQFVAIQKLLEELETYGAVLWGGYGLLHCLAALLTGMTSVQWQHPSWAECARSCVRACAAAQARALPVVAHVAPEGHLPDELKGDASFLGGRAVTAQMVLVCAWRTIKESSEVLGVVGGSHPRAAAGAGQRLARVLARATHRGALDHAALGLRTLAERCWSTPRGRRLPRAWLRGVLRAARAVTAVTRRGAGLPAALQALVTAELAATGRAECFNECMTILLQQATADDDALRNNDLSDDAPRSNDFIDHFMDDDDDSVNDSDSDDDIFSVDLYDDAPNESPDDDAPNEGPNDDAPKDNTAVGAARRALAANILRALFRDSSLEGASRVHVPAGLLLAVRGFDSHSWTERTAMSLLLAALWTRAFGVARRGVRGAVHARNTLPARVFFARHPHMHELMMSKLREAQRCDGVSSGVYPVLLLLARLYPTAHDGAGTGAQLSPLLALVRECARAVDLRTRQLAAAALRALLPQHQYFSYIEEMFLLLSSRSIPRNHCHGVLVQLSRLLETPPASGAPRASPSVGATPWLLAQAVGSRPCYVIAREYVNVVHLLVWKFPELIPEKMISEILMHLEDLLFKERLPPITAGRELCLADCLYLYLILLHRGKNNTKIVDVILNTIHHKTYEVALSTLNYLLLLHREMDVEDCYFLEHLDSICDRKVLEMLRLNSAYVSALSEGFNGKYLECKSKCLRLLSLENDTQLAVINETAPSDCVNIDEWVVSKLIERIEFAHDNMAHVYLESLLKFVSGKILDLSLYPGCVLDVASMVYARSSSENSDLSRSVVVSFLGNNAENMMKFDVSSLPDTEQFRYKATILATLVTFIEDDDDDIRKLAADVVAKLTAPFLLANAIEVANSIETNQEDAISMGKIRKDVMFKDDTAMDDNSIDNTTKDVTNKDNTIDNAIYKDVDDATSKDAGKVIFKNTSKHFGDVIKDDATSKDFGDVISKNEIKSKNVRDVKSKNYITSKDAGNAKSKEDATSQELGDITFKDDSTSKDVGDIIFKDDATSKDVGDVISKNDITSKVIGDVIFKDNATSKDVVDVISKNDITSKDVGDVIFKDGATSKDAISEVTLGDGSLGRTTLGHVVRANGDDGIIAAVCGDMLREYVEESEDGSALLVLLALLDFRSEVCMTDELNDECRVFDQSERYNIFLEENVWTEECADKIIKINRQKDSIDYVLAIIRNEKYLQTFEMLCNDNVSVFVKMAQGKKVVGENVNPKIELFVRKLRRLC